MLFSWLLSTNQTSKHVHPAEPSLPLLTAGAGVGRLGVITDLTFRIVPQQAVQRTLKARCASDVIPHVAAGERPALHVAAAAVPATATLAFLATLWQWLMCCTTTSSHHVPRQSLQEMSFDDFVSQLQETQADYVAAKQVCRPGLVTVCSSVPAAGCAQRSTLWCWGHPCAPVPCMADFVHGKHARATNILHAMPHQAAPPPTPHCRRATLTA